jgi:uncharacterized glyoxalase superfamily protein PhnB
MGPKKLWSAPPFVPSLACKDVPAAAEWLARAFGFRERSEARLTWPGGCLTWIELGDVLVHLTTDGGHELRSPAAVGGASVGLKLYVDDLDAHFQRAREAGAVIVSEPQDGFWGGRVYWARDPEGHHWEFSQAGRDLDASQWALPPGVKRGID